MDTTQTPAQAHMAQLRQPRGVEPTQSPIHTMAGPPPVPSPLRQRQLRSEESWVDIASTPSSASLSSANEEIITTGLRVQHDSTLHRRRRARNPGQFIIGTGYRAASTGAGSSQDEYDESESESDRVMTSSNEGIGPSPLQRELRRSSPAFYSVASSDTMSEREGDDEDEECDDDENATTVNYPRSSRRPFEPRPNAFSHPPTAHQMRTQAAAAGSSYPPRRPGARPSSQRHSYPQHSPYSPTPQRPYQPEHDEVLRTSLSTLLTAAAAVRGRPKPGTQTQPEPPAPGIVDPTSLRLVSESVALGAGAGAGAGTSPATETTTEYASTSTSASRTPSSHNLRALHPSKRRKPSPHTARTRVRGRSTSRESPRAAKRARIEDISPTLMTWVVSAGVVVLVSALTFSAGYVVGKEAGHAEAMEALGQVGGVGGAEGGRCGKEVGRGMGAGLRRFRFGSGVRA